MAHALIWTDPALSDLEAVAHYIAIENEPAAAKLVTRVFKHVEMLTELPGMGPRIPELRDNLRYRQLSEPPLRIFYRFDAELGRILVLAVMRTERLFQSDILTSREKTLRKKVPGKKDVSLPPRRPKQRKRLA